MMHVHYSLLVRAGGALLWHVLCPFGEGLTVLVLASWLEVAVCIAGLFLAKFLYFLTVC